MEKIKNCPFCGYEARYITHKENDGYSSYTVGLIICNNCGCSTPKLIIDGYYGATTTHKDIYKIWNNRV